MDSPQKPTFWINWRLPDVDAILELVSDVIEKNKMSISQGKQELTRASLKSKQPEKIDLETQGELTNSASESASRAARRAQEMLHRGVARPEILTELVAAAEQVAGKGAVCSMLMLDREGLLRNVASPNLPADYLAAIDRLKPNPLVGTCAAAAATGAMVVTCDFQADDKWEELRHLPLSLGFLGAWSMPIKGVNGKVLGTLGTYFRERRSPTPSEVKSIEILVAAAGLILEGHEIRKEAETAA